MAGKGRNIYAQGANWLAALTMALVVIVVTACGAGIKPIEDGIGPNPALPPPESSLLPTINIAPAIGWKDAQPRAADGLVVNTFANVLDHPRWIYVLPNGDVLVAETNAPPRPADAKGIRGWVMGKVMKRAGATVPSANRISLLRDQNGDGIVELRTVFIDGLNSPFGMALIENQLYVANTDALLRFPYQNGATRIDDPGTVVAKLPAGPINHHWTKNVIATQDKRYLLVTVGSNSNIAENGMENEVNRAAILKIDPQSGSIEVYASGLRNPNGLDWNPDTGELWTTVNERDELGSDLVPDYMTSVTEGAFYGWPYSYYGQHVDVRAKPARPDLVAKAVVPDYALGSHTASLSLAFNTGKALPMPFRDGAFIGQHGSWNRKELSGYKVIFVPFSNGKPDGLPLNVLTGFLNNKGDAFGRPVGVAIDATGSLLVADDVGNVIWRVTSSAQANHDPNTGAAGW